MHSSLSHCGQLVNGPATVIGALDKWLSDGVGLALPTHTWSYPDAAGVAPLYDFEETPSVVGAITNYFWKQPGVERSLHPSHSIAYRGPNAVTFVADHNFVKRRVGEALHMSDLLSRTEAC